MTTSKELSWISERRWQMVIVNGSAILPCILLCFKTAVNCIFAAHKETCSVLTKLIVGTRKKILKTLERKIFSDIKTSVKILDFVSRKTVVVGCKENVITHTAAQLRWS